MNEIVHCNRCGENYFTEDLDEKGICKLCNMGTTRFIKHEEDSDIED